MSIDLLISTIYDVLNFSNPIEKSILHRWLTTTLNTMGFEKFTYWNRGESNEHRGENCDQLYSG